MSAALAADPRLARVEAALSRSCARAVAGGVTLIRGDFEVTVPCSWDRRERVVVGVCALGAYNLFGGPIAIPVLDAEEAAVDNDGPWDAIEMGWDGESGWRKKHPRVEAWYDVGARLAAKYKPVPVDSLERA